MERKGNKPGSRGIHIVLVSSVREVRENNPDTEYLKNLHIFFMLSSLLENNIKIFFFFCNNAEAAQLFKKYKRIINVS